MELRFNPLLRDWVMVAAHRQHRPHLPAEHCPFCPGSGKVPDHYDLLIYDNDFPVLVPDPPAPDDVATGLYRSAPSYGKCEVVLYTPEHDRKLWELDDDHLARLVDLWAERFQKLGADPNHRYVLIFENRGEEVGVTIHHPHGQIYAYPFIPLKIARELESMKFHHQETGRCLMCDINETELEFVERVIAENEHFIAYIPFFTDFPYGVFIASKAHRPSLLEMKAEERRALAKMLRRVVGAFDRLFQKPFPYMMVLHQQPVDGEPYDDYVHFHIEFYPPLRAADKLKFYASSEIGAWATANPRRVEETAEELRRAYRAFLRELGEQPEKA
ncbi:galactose-1-phosphate uridylyltransferase [Hydrogenibacillus sp. N12]|uniref:Galactose-1-phosphate uridylyltransferase n=1 Tax=Hydrogenibacillus schlegelii TaxID=1484 RepID=A0A947CZK8_HYDSH|nr:galactose-1-phosphate uridylyltransferase [Hydrogenibacillus sp. N12]MBT9282750.1 galactose-1-phosphate uridylyltransferase [Hydrogenibacillus schlegelii]QZA33258.1 galactose-1-phosphate uridylyltransferase [Hydrogenibacillus sp. N12]